MGIIVAIILALSVNSSKGIDPTGNKGGIDPTGNKVIIDPTGNKGGH
jgi:hypothetical protein